MPSDIEWTDETWNPTVGCSRVSAGCEHCYAEGVAHRGMRPEHKGLTVLGKHGPRWTGEVRLVPERLWKPLTWKKPRRVFVDSMSDLFHPDVPFEYIAAVYGVMAACPHVTFQIATKRIERALEFYQWLKVQGGAEYKGPERLECCWQALRHEVLHHPEGDGGPLHQERGADPDGPWPLPNVWLIASCEDQDAANRRVPVLLQCPAVVLGVSAEPLLGPLDLARFMWPVHWSWDARYKTPEEALAAGASATRHRQALVSAHARFLDWVIVGGESGRGARPCNVEWLRSIVRQCGEAGVACFVKQLGSVYVDEVNGVGGARCKPDESVVGKITRLKNSKGGDIAEFPEDLRKREWPEVRHD